MEPHARFNGEGFDLAKKGLFVLETGLLGLKMGQKAGFNVTNQLTGKNYKLLILC
jgi:hypothetical protein